MIKLLTISIKIILYLVAFFGSFTLFAATVAYVWGSGMSNNHNQSVWAGLLLLILLTGSSFILTIFVHKKTARRMMYVISAIVVILVVISYIPFIDLTSSIYFGDVFELMGNRYIPIFYAMSFPLFLFYEYEHYRHR